MSKSRKKKSKSIHDQQTDAEFPRIIVIRRGIVNQETKQLAQNLRLMLSPNCATRLKEGSRQKLRDFTSVADLLGLTHLVVLSQSSNGTYLKVANFPKGPTITFKVDKLSLISDVAKHTTNPPSLDTPTHAPLLVLNGFSRKLFNKKRGEDESLNDFSNNDDVMKSVTETLNTMIGPIDLATTKIQNCKRVILFHKKDNNKIVLRHYSINLVDCNTSSQVKDLLNRKTMKNIIGYNSDFQIISTHLSGDGNETNSSELDGSTDEVVELDKIFPHTVIAKNKYGIELEQDENTETQNQIAIRLNEIGPRLLLTLVKIQQDVFTGSVKYHKFVKKTPEELEENKKLEQNIINKRKLESERIMKLYEKYVKKPDNSGDSGKLERGFSKNKSIRKKKE